MRGSWWLAGLVGAVALLAACGGDDDDSAPPTAATTEAVAASPTAAGTATPEPAASPPSGSVDRVSPDRLLELAEQASEFITSMRYRSTLGPDSAGNYIESTIEIIVPDRSRQVDRLGEQERTFIRIGRDVWAREGDGPWQQTQSEEPFVFPPPEPEQRPPIVPVVMAYEELDGRRCAVVSFEQQVSLQDQRAVEFRQWICEDDYLVRKSETWAVQGGERQLRVTSHDFEYDVPIEPIEPPQ